MANQKDYYKVLSVSEDTTPEDIKKTYRNLAFQYHPDRNPGNEEKMKEINEAYAVLSDERKRREYDSLRKDYGFFARDHFRQTYSDDDIFRDSDIQQVFEELSRMFGFHRPEDIFSRSNFYGSQYFATIETMEKKLPSTKEVKNAAIIFVDRDIEETNNTFISWLQRYTKKLQASGSRLILAEIHPNVKEQLEKTETLKIIGEENIFVSQPLIPQP